ncbi:MAG: molybdopterin-synthase adenylyltransferase MoeB [Euryarchaeota archaeon]|nr:molybdopterin-synthase adenylyltransferase MoeB [Euryarchaeota archaeon]
MLGFTEEEIKRYSRQIILNEVGGKGQKKLRSAKILVVGAGGLGAPALIYLAAAGIGTLGVIDFDKVDVSNLQRQVIHLTKDIGKPKTESAKEFIESLNPNVKVETFQTMVTPKNVFDIIKDYDAVLDGSDNFPTRFLINDACVIQKKPIFHGSVFRFEGQVTTIIPGETPCYRCIFPEQPPEGLIPSCQEGGVLGTVPGTIALIQSTEVLKYILKIGTLLKGRLLIYDAINMAFNEFQINKDPKCPVCGENPTITDVSQLEYGHVCVI